MTQCDDDTANAPPTPAAERAVFRAEGARLVPTGLARGPWYPDTQHGSAMLGLLARAIDRHPSERPVQVARFTADMMRAAPMRPVETRCRTIRSGRSLEVVEATLEADGETFARATALRFRLASIDVGASAPRYAGTAVDLPPPEACDPLPGFDGGGDEPFHRALEMRRPRGLETPVMWFRMSCPLVAGEPLSPFVRTAVTADWTYSVPQMLEILRSASIVLQRGFSAINPDTTVNLHRPVQGEWICLDAHAFYGDEGAGTALAFLHDEHGPVGHASQCILIRSADKRPIIVGELQGASPDPAPSA